MQSLSPRRGEGENIQAVSCEGERGEMRARELHCEAADFR